MSCNIVCGCLGNYPKESAVFVNSYECLLAAVIWGERERDKFDNKDFENIDFDSSYPNKPT